MSVVGKKIDEVIKLEISPYLKKEGFKKKARTWHKHVGENCLVINVQASTSNINDSGKFAVNIGVYNSIVAKLCGREITKQPKEYECAYRKRLGALDENSDHWWIIDRETDLKSISMDVVEKLSDHGMQWLESLLDVRVLSEKLAKQPSIESFSAALLEGDKEKSIARVRNALDERPAARATYLIWARENGLNC